MTGLFRRGRCDRGSASIEYALFAALVAMALVGPAEAMAKRLAASADIISANLGPPEVRFAPDDEDCEPFQVCG